LIKLIEWIIIIKSNNIIINKLKQKCCNLAALNKTSHKVVDYLVIRRPVIREDCLAIMVEVHLYSLSQLCKRSSKQSLEQQAIKQVAYLLPNRVVSLHSKDPAQW